MNKNAEGYTAYEYREIKIPEHQSSFYLDCYEALGWETDERTAPQKGLLFLRRDRKQTNRTELIRLQRNLEACMEEINRLEASETSSAHTDAFLLGMLGCGLVAGAVFAVTATPPVYWLCCLLGLLGFIAWGCVPSVFRFVKCRRTAFVRPLIDNKYEEIYKICDKAHTLSD